MKYRNNGFTLAEVLITLGIIGVVAAMTLPILSANYKKQVTAAKLKKFYSVMQQAILLTEKDYGDMKSWLPTSEQKLSSDEFEKWYNNYLGKNIKTISKKKLSNTFYQVGFADGSGFVAYIGNGSELENTSNILFFYCTELKYCGIQRYDGQNSFLFSIITVNNRPKFVAGIHGTQNLSRDELLELCAYGNYDDSEASTEGKRHTCSQVVMLDGWEFKKDYPWRQTILVKED